MFKNEDAPDEGLEEYLNEQLKFRDQFINIVIVKSFGLDPSISKEQIFRFFQNMDKVSEAMGKLTMPQLIKEFETQQASDEEFHTDCVREEIAKITLK